MKRKIIQIDEAKCNGCGLCVDACHEGALQMINGKAKLISDSYCDGLGDCLPECPTGAIKIIEREAAEFDVEAVKANMKKKAATKIPHNGGGCPGSKAMMLAKKEATPTAPAQLKPTSQLQQWPVQIKLVPVNAPYFNNASLLVAADCTAFAYANIHQDFMRNKITIIGCPKLDAMDYSEKLTAIISNNNIKNITVLRMEVPCCGGMEHAVKKALINSGKMLPWQVVTITSEGNIKEN
ncbi:4Fe-4S dicluster domain-containing protein [Clostridium sp. 'deep sea']|uniref:ATP-binding protein n=1 Tax=Clostridium sp. 'deep sea' TaxID=2779445 RepID=UPI00189698D6|nr:4Fe-4S dicluster domain-containing protein [Clostridium sp. 'deep sea']QOR34022.1 4Fe-4S dicluster domain-containing protein [Clostridium sp. 'deep sea']